MNQKQGHLPESQLACNCCSQRFSHSYRLKDKVTHIWSRLH